MNHKEQHFISAIIYVHNAENRIIEFFGAVLEVLEDNFEHSEIICVNDCSNDESISAIRNIAQEATTVSISVLNMSFFHGLEMAMNAGKDLAIGDFVFEFDSTELDFDKKEIMEVYRKSMEGYDIVSATPDIKGKVSSRFFYRMFEFFGNFSYRMSTESFRILSRRVINRVSSMSKTIPYRKAVYANCGLKTKNISYVLKQTDIAKVDKKEKKYRFRLAIDSLILFTGFGYRLSLFMTLVMMVISVFMLSYSVVIYITAHPVEGWTTTILFLAISFFGLFGVLTVIVKYLQILVELVFKRKHYSFEVLRS